MEILPLARLLFWLSGTLVFYSYFGYALLIALLARCFGRPPRRLPLAEENLPAVSLVIVAHNEEARIDKRIQSVLAVDYPAAKLEVLVVCDGCTDGTATIARRYADVRVHVLELPQQVGKAAALTQGCTTARHPILVLADVRQSWEPQTLRLLVENFTDPTIGAVSGNLVLERAPGALGGVGLYWRYEKWLRGRESLLYSMVGLSGSVSALRRELFRPIPRGTMLDDVYWPLQVAMQGYRVVLDERARVYDQLPESSRDEFRRKVRTLSGNLQLAAWLPSALLPWRNPVWFQFVSHKLSRLVVPWALLALLVTSLCLDEPIYQAAFWTQIGGYLAGLSGIFWKPASRVRLVSVAASFLVLNAAAWLAFWVWLVGKSSRSWVKVNYNFSPPSDHAARQAAQEESRGSPCPSAPQ